MRLTSNQYTSHQNTSLWYDIGMTSELTPAAFTPAAFVKGIIGTDEIVEDTSRAHVAFIGRSNVGKSSIMNALLGRKSLVKSSARPGKTTEINLFTVGEGYYFVDLPGYGFARLGAKQREKLRRLILWYLVRLEIPRRLVCVVIDAQVGLTDFDREITEELEKNTEAVCIIANKTDRLNQKAQVVLKRELDTLNLQYFMVSAKTSRGIDKIQEYIIETLRT